MQHWLESQISQPYTLDAPQGDASSRRYWRVRLADGSTRMLMDAPEGSSLPTFLQMARLLAPHVRVPNIWAVDEEAGFVLLDDLGEQDLQTVLGAGDAQLANRLYLEAAQQLLAMQTGTAGAELPDYDALSMAADLDRFSEWYCAVHLQKPLQGEDLAQWERCRALLVLRAQAQGKVLIHFDYHSRNLLLDFAGQMGVIDFQDARMGPIAYDLASLLKDMYCQCPEDIRLDVLIRYWDAARKQGLPVPAAFDDFFADFEWMGVFRQIRTLGTFARLVHRDGKPDYANDMPQALHYLRETCARYVELHPLYKLLNRLTGFSVETGYTF